MSYEVRDGVMWGEGLDGATRLSLGPVDQAVADALDVLRAAEWTVETQEGKYLPYPHVEQMKPGYGTHMRTVARSPWREVEK